jgi:hypothetical protein
MKAPTFAEICYGFVGEDGTTGKGVLRLDTIVERLGPLVPNPTFGQRSKLDVRVKTRVLAFTTPLVSKSVLVAPDPLSSQRKL